MTTSIAQEIWNIRNIAASERREAEDIIGKEVDDNKLRRGEFMGHAALARMTHMLPERFQHKLPDLRGSDYLLRGQKRQFGSPINPKFTRNVAGAKAAGQPFPHIAVGSPLEYQVSKDRPTPVTRAVKPPTTSSTKKQPAVKVHDEKLGNFLAAVALSLSATIDSIGKKASDTQTEVERARSVFDDIHKKLEMSGDGINDKLDAIIDALRANNNYFIRKDKKDDARVEEIQIEKEKENYKSSEIQKRNEDQLEFELRKAKDDEEDARRQQIEGAGDSQFPDPWMDNNVQQFERGGIARGPDTGYPVILHGDEAVIPLDNRATDNIAGNEVTKPSLSVTPKTSIVNNLGDFTKKDQKSTVNRFNANTFNNVAMFDQSEVKDARKRVYNIMMKPITKIGEKLTSMVGGDSNTNALTSNNGFVSNVVEKLSSVFNSTGDATNTSVSNNLTKNSSYGGNPKRMGGGAGAISSQAGSGGHTHYGKGGPVGGATISPSVPGKGNVFNMLHEWWNKGRNMRVPNERNAPWKTLLDDDAKQLTKTNKAFKQGAKGIKGWRPLKAFTPKMFRTGPTPAVRQFFERPVRTAIGGSKIAGRGIAGGVGGFIMDMIFPEPVGNYDQLTGPYAVYNNPKLTEEQRYFMMKHIFPSGGANDLQYRASEQSRGNALTRLEHLNNESKPIVINKVNEAVANSANDVPLEHIVNVGDPGLNQFYPPPY